MSNPIEQRVLIRTLAARMHRARIAGVLSVAGGVPSIDEGQLSADQRFAAEKILEEVAAGILTVEIGVSPVKPAEFVVFRISQFAGGAGLEE